MEQRRWVGAAPTARGGAARARGFPLGPLAGAGGHAPLSPRLGSAAFVARVRHLPAWQLGVAHGGDRSRRLQSLLFPPFYVPKTTKCDRVFQQMQRSRTGLALVVDEYGRTCGLVTMGDLLDELFGDLDEAPAAEAADAGDGAETGTRPQPEPGPPAEREAQGGGA